MPGFAHLFTGLLLSALFIKMTENKFNYRHGIIFSVNTMFGPDLFGFLPYVGEGSQIYYFFHGYGWPIAALVIALPWMVINNTKLTPNSEEKLRIQLSSRTEEDPYRLKYIQVFCLVAAGGIFHQFLDLIGHPPQIYHADVDSIVPWGAVWFGGDVWFSMNEILGTGLFPCGNTFNFVPFYVFMGIMAVFALVGVFILIPKKEGKNFLLISAFLSGFYTLILGISYFIPDPHNAPETLEGANYFGDPSHYPYTYYLTGGEADLGVMVYMLLFFFVPMVLIYYGYKGFSQKPKETEPRQEDT